MLKPNNGEAPSNKKSRFFPKGRYDDQVDALSQFVNWRREHLENGESACRAFPSALCVNGMWYSHTLCALWDANGAALISRWVRDRAGSRPHAFWRYGEPQVQRDERRIEPRRREQTSGPPIRKPFANIAQCYERGLPTIVVDDGERRTFESQAQHLARCGLLLDDERARLTAADFEPEPLLRDDDDEVRPRMEARASSQPEGTSARTAVKRLRYAKGGDRALKAPALPTPYQA